MPSIKDEIESKIITPVAKRTMDVIMQILQNNAPEVTGNLKRSLYTRQVGRFRWSIFGPKYALDVERGTPDRSSETWTRRHRHRYNGRWTWVERTYHGQRPMKITKKLAGGGNPWRIVNMVGKEGTRFIRRSLRETFQRLFGRQGEIKNELPDVIVVTSLEE